MWMQGWGRLDEGGGRGLLHVSKTGVEVFSPVFWDNSGPGDVVSHGVH